MMKREIKKLNKNRILDLDKLFNILTLEAILNHQPYL